MYLAIIKNSEVCFINTEDNFDKHTQKVLGYKSLETLLNKFKQNNVKQEDWQDTDIHLKDSNKVVVEQIFEHTTEFEIKDVIENVLKKHEVFEITDAEYKNRNRWLPPYKCSKTLDLVEYINTKNSDTPLFDAITEGKNLSLKQEINEYKPSNKQYLKGINILLPSFLQKR